MLTILLAALATAGWVLLFIALHGNRDLAAENRRLHAQVVGYAQLNAEKAAALRSRAHHPAGRGIGADVIALREALEDRDAGADGGAV